MKEQTPVEVKRIEALIHPAFNLTEIENPVVAPSYLDRQRGWHAQAVAIANDPQAVLFYFSSFRVQIRDGCMPTRIAELTNERFFFEDQVRIRTFKELLGNRLFCFPCNTPRPEELMSALSEQGLSLGNTTTLLAYGEYLDACVSVWGNLLQTMLGIPYENYTIGIAPHLSLHTKDDVNFPKRKEKLIKDLERTAISITSSLQFN